MKFQATLQARQQDAIGEFSRHTVEFIAPDLASRTMLQVVAFEAARTARLEPLHMESVRAIPDMRDIGEIVDDFLKDYDQWSGRDKTLPVEVIVSELRGDVFFVLAAEGPVVISNAGPTTIQTEGHLIYHYGTDEWTCTFHTYSEVGAPYQYWFNWQLQAIANSDDPEREVDYTIIRKGD